MPNILPPGVVGLPNSPVVVVVGVVEVVASVLKLNDAAALVAAGLPNRPPPVVGVVGFPNSDDAAVVGVVAGEPAGFPNNDPAAGVVDVAVALASVLKLNDLPSLADPGVVVAAAVVATAEVLLVWVKLKPTAPLDGAPVPPNMDVVPDGAPNMEAVVVAEAGLPNMDMPVVAGVA